MLTYFNQPEHEAIDRHNVEALEFLCQLAAATVTSRAAPPPVDLTANMVKSPLERLQATLGAAQLPVPKVKTSGSGWQLTWTQHLLVGLFGPVATDRQTLIDMDYQVIDIPLDEARWPVAIEALKSSLGA